MDNRADSQDAGAGKKRPATTMLRLDELPEQPRPTKPRPHHSALDQYKHHHPRRQSLRLVRIILFPVVLLTLAGIVYGVYKREEGIRERKIAIILKAQVDDAATLRESIAAKTEHALALTRTIHEHARETHNAAAYITSGAVPENPVPRAEPAPDPGAEAEPETPAETVATPGGILSREEIERQRRAKTTAPAVAAPKPRPAARPPKSEAERLADDARDAASLAAKDAVDAREIDAKANLLEQRVGLARDPIATRDPIKELRELHVKATDIEKTLVAMVEDMRTKAARANEIRTAVATERERLEAEQRERAEQARRLALAARERADADRVRLSGAEYFRQGRFDQALESATRGRERCETEDGHKAFDILIEKYRLAEGLHAFIVEQLGKGPLRWGWVQDGSPRDILGANARGVQIKERTVAWEDVSVAQTMHFIKHFTLLEQIPARTRAKQSLAAAIYCREMGGDKAARMYADRAVSLDPALDGDVERLLPELP